MKLDVYRHFAQVPVVLLLLASCTPSTPPLASGLSSDQFHSRLDRLFPRGTDGEALRQRLAAEGFLIRSEPYAGSYSGHTADLGRDTPFCMWQFHVRWITESTGRIESVRAWHSCTLLIWNVAR